MTDECSVSAEKITKDCFVVLERLDEKLLNHYLRRNSNTGSSRNDIGTIKKRHKGVTSRKNKEGTQVKAVSRKRKRKVKPLRYTDDEDDSTETKCESTINVNSNSQAVEEIKSESREMSCKVERTEEEEGRKGEVPVESGDSGFTDCSSVVESEVEIIQEFTRSSRGNVICDKTIGICDVESVSRVKSEQPKQEQEQPEEEEDSRDEGEDDRETVTFEGEVDVEIIEVDEKDMSMKFKNKKTTNRRKRRLVCLATGNSFTNRKFKRKSISGGNRRKIRKGKKFLENGGDAAEKSPDNCIAEGCFREFCTSVRRLHEMYTIIMQLQREMPKDTELAVHFKRVISAQQENFHGEIRKTQELIIRSFEKMLKLRSNNLDKVAKDVGSRTYLTAEEVIYVLSLCMQLDGSRSADKSKLDSIENTRKVRKASSNPKTSPQVAVNTNTPVMAPPPRAHPLVGVGHEPGPQPQASFAFPPPSARQRLQPCNNHMDKYNQRYYLAQQNFENARILKNALNDIRMRQCKGMNPRPPFVRQPAPPIQPPNPIPHGYNNPYPNQHWLYPPRPRPPSHATLYPTIRNYQQGGVAPPVAGRLSALPVRVPPQGHFNFIPDKPNHGAPVLVQNTPRYNHTSQRPQTLNQPPPVTQTVPPLETVHRSVAHRNDQVTATPRTDSQCHLNFAASARYSNAPVEKPAPGRLPVPVALGDNSKNPTADRTDVAQVLNPTTPQKLTMKNCRLQAGPVLDSGGSSEGGTKRPENPDPDHSRPRVYICAGDGCNNHGVRICNSCRSVIYCSETCQLKHWDLKHKAECCQLRELRNEMATLVCATM